MKTGRCKCNRSEGMPHHAGCDELARSYAGAIEAKGIYRARNSSVIDGLTQRPIDESPLFQSVVDKVEARLRDALSMSEFLEWN